jgi:hypothetical protein
VTPTPRPSDDDPQLDVAGAAARTRIREYRANTDEPRDRSLAGLLEWSASIGVKVPEYAKVMVNEDFQPTRLGVPVDAKYFEI